MAPGAFDQPVIGRQRGHIQTEVGRTLHIAVTAEDVGTGAGRADIAGGQQEDREGSDVRSANRLLSGTHAPHQRCRLLGCHHLGNLLHLRFWDARDALYFLRVPLLHFGADVVHAVDALADEFLIFPAVLEDVPQQTPHYGDVGARPDAHIVGCMRGGAGEARIDDDQVGLVVFLAIQDMLQRNRVGLGRVAAHDHDSLGIVQIVVAVGLRAVAPGVRNAGHRRGVADARLMIDRVGAPECREFAEQIGPFVRELRRTKPVN